MASIFERGLGKPASSGSLHDLPKHELVEKYRPRFIGQGSESLVYEAEGRRGVVLKANKQALAESISSNLKHGLAPDARSSFVDELEKTKLAEARKAYEDLRRVFGNHVLPQKQFVMNVPYNTGVLHELQLIAKVFELNVPKQGDGSSWTIVSVQRRTKAMEDFRRVSMGGGGLEGLLAQRPTFDVPEASWPLYAKVTDELMSRESSEQSGLTSKEVEKLYGPTRLSVLLEKAKQEPKFREALADFQTKAVRHAEETGDILDIIGADNIIFNVQKDGSYDYTMVDAIYPFEKKMLAKAKEALAAKRSGQELSTSQRITIREAVGYVRTINAIGKAIGTGAFIDFAPKESAWAGDLAKDVTGRDQVVRQKQASRAPAEESPDLPPAASRKPGGLFGPIPNFRDRMKRRP